MFKETTCRLRDTLNLYGSKKEPFFFLINYDLKQYDIIPLDQMPNDILYSINNQNIKDHKISLQKYPIDFKLYKNSFNKIKNHIKNGNSYLANLTFTTPIILHYSLKEIYHNANAKFKLYYKDQFVSFSPEQFIQIEDNKIFTYPMKGTIKANIKDASNKLLDDPKEKAEHTMIVDLLRNDLSIVAKDVKVEKFRYISKIKAGTKELLQTSSKISGILDNSWQNNIGDILISLLPAGSITGTPKRKTIEILNNIEDYNRGYFTGIFGIFDGNSLNSAVLIRFIEKIDNNLFYKSGGGITSDSDIVSEYNEMIDKVYIP